MSADFAKLGEVAEVIDSLHKTPEYSEIGYSMVRCTDVKYGPLSMDGTLKVDASVFAEFSRRYKPQQSDIIITRVGSYGNMAHVVDTDFCLGQNTAAIVPKINPRFLYFVLNSPQVKRQIEFSVVGSTQKTLSLKAINNLDIPRFDPLVEDQIAEILGSLDDKIELNRQTNQTLEQIAQTLFKSWFVDFEPVKAKIEAKTTLTPALSQRERELVIERAAMCAISGKSEPKLSQLSPEQYQQLAATAALFPDELVESELELNPKGWEVKSLPEAIEVNPSRFLKKGTIAPYLDMANVPTNTVRATNVIPREFNSGSKFMNGDTLLARITPCLENGKTAFVDFLERNQVGWGSTEFIVFRPKAPLPEAFGYMLCRLPEFRAFAIANMSGTSGRQRVPNGCFENYLLAVPDSGISTAFGVVVGNLLKGIKKRDEESSTLATLRDTLLPKLLSGELTIGECEREMISGG